MGVVVSMSGGVKSAIRRFPGKLPAYHLLLRLRRAHRVPALARLERTEAANARAAWGSRPVAPVAVVIPTYRRPELVGLAVESVLAQTRSDLVVAVIDDGAGLPALPEDPRVFAYSLGRNCGVAGVVRNVGIRATASRHLAFLDDDNIWEPDHLDVSLTAHERGADLTYTALERHLPSGEPVDILSVPWSREEMKEHGIVDTNTIVVRRSAAVRFSRIPLERDDFPIEDWELVWRLSRTHHVEHIPRVTARYLVHDESYFTDWQRVRNASS